MEKLKTASVNVRIQKDIKEKAENILENIGISRATAIDMFYRQIIVNDGIPFKISTKRQISIYDEMTTDEVKKVLIEGYKQSVNGETKTIEEVFDSILNNGEEI